MKVFINHRFLLLILFLNKSLLQNQNHNLQKGPGCKGFQGLKHRTIESRVPLQPTIPRLREKRLDLSPREVCYFLINPGMVFAVTGV